MLHIKFHFDWPRVSEKKIFEKCVWTTDWPRSRDDLDLYNHIPSFVEINLPVLEKKIFEGFLPYMGVVAILVM